MEEYVVLIDTAALSFQLKRSAFDCLGVLSLLVQSLNIYIMDEMNF